MHFSDQHFPFKMLPKILLNVVREIYILTKSDFKSSCSDVQVDPVTSLLGVVTLQQTTANQQPASLLGEDRGENQRQQQNTAFQVTHLVKVWMCYQKKYLK